MKLTNFQAVIFDMDGVIINSEVIWAKKELAFFKEFSDQWTDADQQNITGRSLPDIYDYISQKYSLSLSKPEFLSHYDQVAQTVYGQETQLLPGIIDLLKQIKNQHLTIALASSAPHPWIQLVLDRFDLNQFFKVVVSSDDVHGKGKPAPEIYLLTAKKLNLKPQQCLVIEDSVNGVKAAQAAHMACIWLKPSTHPISKDIQPDRIVTSHSEIIALIR